MSSAEDFACLPLDSLESLALALSEGDFPDRVAWRQGREGKPGYWEGGFLEEAETWRLRDSDPEERPRVLARIREAVRRGRMGQ